MGGAPASIPYKGNGESRCAPVFSLGKRAIVSAPRGCEASAEKFLERGFFEGPAALWFFRKKERRTRSGWRKKIDYI